VKLRLALHIVDDVHPFYIGNGQLAHHHREKGQNLQLHVVEFGHFDESIDDKLAVGAPRRVEEPDGIGLRTWGRWYGSALEAVQLCRFGEEQFARWMAVCPQRPRKLLEPSFQMR